MKIVQRKNLLIK